MLNPALADGTRMAIAMPASPSALAAGAAPRRGAFIVIVGPDGVGKTTIARAIIAQHAGPTAYFHFLPSVRDALAAAPPTDLAGPPPKTGRDGSRVLGWLRLLRNVARCWITYVSRIAPALERGSLVVGDRWLYGYVVQPLALRYYGPARLAGAVLRILPRPDLVVNLNASPAVIHARKQELTLEHIETELRGWARLPSDRLRTFDAAAAPDVIAAQVLATLSGLATLRGAPFGASETERG